MADISWRPPRACSDYWDEWKNCKSIRNRFHHYYTYGDSPSCQQWKTDYLNCREWEKKKGVESRAALRESERRRLAERQSHPSVWEMRKRPPADWHLPLDYGKPSQ